MMKKLIFLALFSSVLLTCHHAMARAGGEVYETQKWEDGTSLKAILIVGPQEDGTPEAMLLMDKTAHFLHRKGVQVRRFYNEKAKWENITAISKHAHILIYSGHGSVMGPNGTGGLCLQSTVSNSTLVDELELAPNALVLFQSVCRGAGSSAGDEEDIGVKEAKKRVIEYAKPFFHVGASAYYANNYQNGCLDFLKDFFDGRSLEDCFLRSMNSRTEVEFRESFPGSPDRLISIASEPGGGKAILTTYTNGVKTVEEVIAPKGYEIAFAGPVHFRFSDLKGN